MPHETMIKVRYSDTDCSGVVHHANYLVFFEIARIDMVNKIGIDHSKLEAEGYFFAVVGGKQRYHAPALYGDELRVQTYLRSVSKIRINFEFKILRGEVSIATGETELLSLSRPPNPRPTPMSDEVLKKARQYVEPIESGTGAES